METGFTYRGSRPSLLRSNDGAVTMLRACKYSVQRDEVQSACARAHRQRTHHAHEGKRDDWCVHMSLFSLI